MPTPYPSPRPGSRPPKSLIKVPDVIQSVLESAGRDLAIEAYYKGHADGWDRSSRQYIEGTVPDTVEYILAVRGRMDPQTIRDVKNQITKLLPEDY